MWPFKKPKQLTETLIMVRYTYQTWKALYPENDPSTWESQNYPNDISAFIRGSVARSFTNYNAQAKHALIATIDETYTEWLADHKKKHSAKSLSKYINEHLKDVEFWNQKLANSQMTNSYNVLGIPGMLMTYKMESTKSEYALTKETSEQVSALLATTYNNQNVFVPGWIVKGCDLPKCAKDMITLAELFWSDGKRVRFGKFLEQNYSDEELVDKFAPLYFTIPFVIKSNVDCAFVDLFGYTQIEQCKTVQAMSAVRFKEDDRSKLLRLVSNEIQQIVSIGPNAVMPGNAYVLYQLGLAKNKLTNVSMH